MAQLLCSSKPRFIICTLCFTASLQIYLYISVSSVLEASFRTDKENIILWWTPFITEEGKYIECGNIQCFLTSNRKFRYDGNLKSILFYGSLFNESDLPLSRKKELWGLLHEESPRNTPLLSHEAVLSLFNYTSTFSRHSDLPLTLQYLPSLRNLTANKYLLSFEQKCNLESDLAPVVYIQSDCSTPNNRDSYVFELMKYIKIDSYGECLNNKQLPPSLSDGIETMMSEELIHLVSRYKFAIAFENANCDDYITEKLWRPLIAGTIPIYHGSSSVTDWLPNNKSAIFPAEYASPKQLADFLNYLSNNVTAYNSYREHKIKQTIDNRFLMDNFRNYDWTISDEDGGLIEEFVCSVCKHSAQQSNTSRVADLTHYSCPMPSSMLSGQHNSSNWWHQDYLVTRCEAAALRHFIQNTRNSDANTVFSYSFIADTDCTLS